MQVRCKMQLTEVHQFTGGYRKFIFSAVYDPSIPEDKLFAKASPSGKFEITVNNQNVDYEVGKYYYFDSTPVPAPPTAP